MNNMSKRGQVLGVPFQLIFSIILIAVFLYVAITAIKSFMQTGEALKLVNFVTDFRNDLEKTMTTTESLVNQKYYMPSGVKYLCFTGDAALMKVNTTNFPELDYYKRIQLKGNYVFFYPVSFTEKIKTKAYAKVDCESSCLNLNNLKNPYCIPAKGIVNITVSKKIGDPYVRIK